MCPARRLCALACALCSCSPAPRWIAVTGGPEQSVLLFNFELHHTDTVALEAGSPATDAISRIAFTAGGSGLIVGSANAGALEPLARVRLADGRLLDHWRPEGGAQATTWTPLSDGRSFIAAGTTPGTHTSPTGSLWFLTAGPSWVSRRLEACDGSPIDVAYFGGGHRAYLLCGANPPVIVDVDARLRRTVKASSAGMEACDPGAIALSRTGGILFVTCRNSGQLLYLDRVTLEPFDSLSAGSGIDALAVSTRRPEAVLINPDRQEAVLVDLRARSVRARIGIGSVPSGMVLSGDGNWIVVVAAGPEGGAGSLVKIDLRRAQIVARTPVPGDSKALALWPGAGSPVLNWR